MGNLKHSPKIQKTSNSLLVFFVIFKKDLYINGKVIATAEIDVKAFCNLLAIIKPRNLFDFKVICWKLAYKEFILKGFHWQHVAGYHVKMDKLLQKEAKVTKVLDDTYEGNQRPKIWSLAVSVLEKWEETFLICRFNFTEQRMYSIPRMADTPIDFGDILDTEYNNFLYPGKIILHHIKIPLLSRPSYFWSIFCIPTLPFINLMYQILLDRWI